jgi:pimeloyl-ACP methyl ester carboxylesterase
MRPEGGPADGDRFVVDVPDRDVEDLRARLGATRFAPRIRPGRRGGTDPAVLRDFVRYWGEEYDWRAAEARLNRLPQRLVDVDGVPLHVVHARGTRQPGSPPPIPIVLTHGWPSSFLEFERLLPLLTSPAEHGGAPGDAFDVVVPSLPGFGFSALPPRGPVEPERIARLWAALMERLGYPRFGAAGGDIGSHVTNFLGAEHAGRVIGVHTHHPPLHPVLDPAVPLTPAEGRYLDERATAIGPDSSYAALQANRPDTAAASLSDSPAGLAAWILEKYHDWGDTAADLFAVFPRETLATIVSLYWFTNTIGTSFRPYVDGEATPPLPPVSVPAAVSLTPEDAGYPREFAERTYRDLRQWRGPERGGHFLALENPGRLARDLADFFRPLRG